MASYLFTQSVSVAFNKFVNGDCRRRSSARLQLTLDGSVSPKVADLDLAVLFDRLIIGPSPYPVPMWTVFVEALRKIGVSDAANRVYLSMIPIRGY